MPRLGNTLLHQWVKRASEEERQKMAELVGISFHYLRSIAYGYRSGAWETVMRMAWAARGIRESGDDEAKKRLPFVQRGDVSPICAECPFYQLCKKQGITEKNKLPEGK